ncbi:hypothetical protein SAMN06265361_1182 [Laceyella tengchongensis]|uniref:Uncharacterized protein n=1 Tax=Laceyella tengchongensis TaxID=574699 RepID=A0AA45WSI6_9BACL|nr:hypothetical protein SAMN06265361_1182 [Laceyella tengchongensis]
MLEVGKEAVNVVFAWIITSLVAEVHLVIIGRQRNQKGEDVSGLASQPAFGMRREVYQSRKDIRRLAECGWIKVKGTVLIKK